MDSAEEFLLSVSKVVIVGRSTVADTEVTFTFGQIDVRTPHSDWSGTCGNMTAAVGPPAIDEDMIPAVEPVTTVRVFVTNTGKRYIAHVPVCTGQAAVEGECLIEGVPAPGACMTREYPEPGGALGGKLLPTGLPRQQCRLTDSRAVTISIVDAAMPTVFVRADELGADATPLAPALNAERTLPQMLGELRCRAAIPLGLTLSPAEAHRVPSSWVRGLWPHPQPCGGSPEASTQAQGRASRSPSSLSGKQQRIEGGRSKC